MWQTGIFFQGSSCMALETRTAFSAEDNEERVTKTWQHKVLHTNFQVGYPLATALHGLKPNC